MALHVKRCGSALVALVFGIGPAFGHHVMDGQLPAGFGDGLLSGLGHPVIGLDHFAAVVAIGCLAAAHRYGVALAVGFVLAMMIGVAVHVQGAGVAGGELLVGLTVIVLGAVMLRRRTISAGTALALFATTGLIHGYVLGESIYGAEPTPLIAYLAGLAVIQSVIALGAMTVTRIIMQRDTEPAFVRLIGAGVAGIGLMVVMQQVIPAV